MSRMKMTLAAMVAVAFTVNLAVSEASAAEKEIVSYRLTKVKTLEFEDAKKAKAHYDAVKSLGCEVKRENHAGHIDVSYRCVKWKKMDCKTHKAAHAWMAWLKASGFETSHSH